MNQASQQQPGIAQSVIAQELAAHNKSYIDVNSIAHENLLLSHSVCYSRRDNVAV